MIVVFEDTPGYTSAVGKEAIMTRYLRRFVPLFALIAIAAAPGFTQTPPDFNMGLGIGVATFADGTWQSLSLTPDLALGKFGIGLDVKLNYRFTGGSGNEFEIRTADWVPADFQDFLNIYLPKVKYVRWDEKGAPLFIKLGSIDDGSLGNGFIMGGYANTLFVPDDRHFGLAFDLDGALFKFPYLGIETFVGDLAEFDVLGARLFTRPLAWLEVPIVKDLQIGATYVTDLKPGLYEDPVDLSKDPVAVYGIDARLPILSSKILSLAVYSDVATIEGLSYGGMVGTGGRLLSFLTYGAQLRVLGPNFIAVYFDATYDLFRSAKSELVRTGTDTETTIGWFATLGTSFLNDMIVFNVALDGPFEAATNPLDLTQHPHLRAVFFVADGLVKGLSFEASYDKKLIDSWASLVDPTEAVIQARLNYQIQAAMLSFVYKLRYDETATPDPWVVTSGIETSIALPF
jgi:hypothetical protein